MKYLDEYRDPEIARSLVRAIERVVSRHFADLYRLQQRVVQFARDASALGQPLVESRTEGGGDLAHPDPVQE